MPVLTVAAGPNGSGKSTHTRALDFEGRENLLDPDAIARRLNPTDPTRAAVASARRILLSMQDYLDHGVSFAIETTLASRKTLQTMRKSRLNGFTVDLIYICLDTPERSIVRVQERVLQGGHDVPDSDVRRRYARSLANLPQAIRIADRAILYDNSENAHSKMLELRQGRLVWSAAKPLPWASAVRDCPACVDIDSGHTPETHRAAISREGRSDAGARSMWPAETETRSLKAGLRPEGAARPRNFWSGQVEVSLGAMQSPGRVLKPGFARSSRFSVKNALTALSQQ